MADKELGALTGAAALSSSDLFYVVQGGNSRKATGAQMEAYLGGGWRLAATQVISTPAASFDFTGLAGANDIMVLLRQVTTSVSAFRILRVSVDNGATFFATSGDYKSTSAAGAETNQDNFSFATSASSSTAFIEIRGAALPVPKFAWPGQGPSNPPAVFTGSLSPIDAVRVAATSGNLTGGTIYVLTR
jgi:hypothetical protein